MQLHIALHINQSDDEARSLQSTAQLSVAVLSALILTIAYFIGSMDLLYSTILAAALATSNIGRAVLARQSANGTIAALTILRSLLVVFTQYAFKSHLAIGLVLGLILAELATALTFSAISVRYGYRPIRVKFLDTVLSNKNFTLWGVIQETVSLGVVLLPVYICNHIYDTNILGHYGTAYRLIWAPAVVLSFGFGLVFLTELSRSPDRFAKILSQIRYWPAVVLILAIAISSFLWLPQIFLLALGDKWSLAAQMSPALAVGAASFLISAPYRQLYRVRQKQLLQMLIDLMTIILMAATYFMPKVQPIEWVMAVSSIAVVQNFLLMVCAMRFQRR